MPLHLLGKKSWNVYNADNIARVQRDEAAARAREEADDQRMQERDAERRLAILRGEVPPPLEDEPVAETSPAQPDRSHRDGLPRKRKRAGEDDTDFEIRVARDRASAVDGAVKEVRSATATACVSLVDERGHISLFSEAEGRRGEKNEEAEREAQKKKREMQDQYQMRLSNAAGRDGVGLTGPGPWYATADGEASAALVPSKNVWGKDDPGRKVREVARLDASDPLAMIKRGAAKVKELAKDRQREALDREREIKELKREERRREKKRRREEGERRHHRDRSRDRHDRPRRDKSDRDRDKERSHRDSEGHRHRSHRPDRDDEGRHGRASG
ncbi:hypothetical protein QBC47DRAFT_20883 [Echria macrotheca]|uniref:CBF1-interacting co-repressor CIR N-terminal domain-containing protein n=1 Tax=Echria macrotheca TaxID=438768 RepID=A0AAJ0FA82_9PEZI|nr:hypothetical protein QBC47DRAFT_20883 [Echria macrotheca]